MLFRRLGKTNLRVSVIGLGTWQFGGEWGRDYTADEVRAIVDACRDCGINLIDTAECYGDHLAEALVGEAIAGERDRWILATKFGHKFNKRFTRDEVWEPASVVRTLDASLKALRTDYVDLLQFHSGADECFFQDELWAVLQKEVEKGKVRHLGNSVGFNGNVKQLEKSADYGIAAIQIIYNYLDRTPEQGCFPVCEQQDLGVLARVPLASGFLSGKYKPGATFNEKDWRSHWMSPEARDKALAEVERIQGEELPPGVPMARWALAWCLRHANVHTVIPGCKDPAQARDNAAAADLLGTVATA